jgi:hypothetical protein
MALVALVTVPDEGAADVVRSALDEVGIPVELRRVGLENPYRGSVLAAPWRIMVPEERLDEARRWLDRVEQELADEVESQAGVAEGSEAVTEPPLPDPTRRSPKIAWALGLAAILVFPVVCFYVRAWRRGALWLGMFLLPLVLLGVRAVSGYELLPQIEPPLERIDTLLLILIWAKLADLFVGLLLIVLRRRSASPA